MILETVFLFFHSLSKAKIAELFQSIRYPCKQTCFTSADFFFKSSFFSWAILLDMMFLWCSLRRVLNDRPVSLIEPTVQSKHGILYTTPR